MCMGFLRLEIHITASYYLPMHSCSSWCKVGIKPTFTCTSKNKKERQQERKKERKKKKKDHSTANLCWDNDSYFKHLHGLIVKRCEVLTEYMHLADTNAEHKTGKIVVIEWHSATNLYRVFFAAAGNVQWYWPFPKYCRDVKSPRFSYPQATPSGCYRRSGTWLTKAISRGDHVASEFKSDAVTFPTLRLLPDLGTHTVKVFLEHLFKLRLLHTVLI